MNPILLTDYYKTEHHRMMPEGTTKLYSNFTPRKSRIPGIDKVLFFGLQYFLHKFFIEEFNDNFFNVPIDKVVAEYKKHINVDTTHIEALHKLGHLPILIKAVPEGTLVPIGVPCFTITNTDPEFFWLTNYLETLISCQMWQIITSATISYEYKKLLTKWAIQTTGSADFVQWQGHDFSMRGMSSVESAILSGMGHLLNFTGTDSIPAIYAMEKYYPEKPQGLIGASVPATEHSVMCMGTKDDEINTFKRLLKLYPTGILSVVSDTWDLWKILTEYLPAIKNEVMSRDGKLVIRPDSGDPVDIICGQAKDKWKRSIQDIPKQKGVIELLWEVFGGTLNEQGYKVLDSHIGAIYGDSITLDRAEQICKRLADKGFASTNIVFGIGSYTYQYNTRDTFGFAMKATYGEVNGVGQEIFKAPITDDGTKKSAKGLLCVDRNESGDIKLFDQQNSAQEQAGILKEVFKNGIMTQADFHDIKKRVKL